MVEFLTGISDASTQLATVFDPEQQQTKALRAETCVKEAYARHAEDASDALRDDLKELLANAQQIGPEEVFLRLHASSKVASRSATKVPAPPVMRKGRRWN